MMRRDVRMLLIIIGLLIISAGIFWVAHEIDSNPFGHTPGSTNSNVQIEYSSFAEEPLLILDPAKEYIDGNGDVTIEALKEKHWYQATRMDISLPVTIAYEVKGLSMDCDIELATLEVSEDAEYTAPRRFTMKNARSSTDVYLLKTNTTYHFRITIALTNNTQTKVEGTFKTANTPRILNIDGVPNMRDIGGWVTTDGSTVRQGLLYRGCEPDGASNPKYTITQSGIDHMLHVLKVRTQLDLRNESTVVDKPSPLGDTVTYTRYNAPAYADVFDEDNAKTISSIFADLANAENYPIYLHDTEGVDQTGTICYLLEAVLGVKDDDLMRDYRLSALCFGDLSESDIKGFRELLSEQPGETTQAKAEAFLQSVGVTAKQIDAIRSIFLEPAPETES
mgnify:CR=1 FL=1